MSVRIYVDTNVYLDYFEDRSDGVRPLGEFAFSVFKRALDCEFEIVISDLVLDEIEKSNAPEIISDSLFGDLRQNRKVVWVHGINQYIGEAKKRSDNYRDALHALLANKMGCNFLVTRNIEHFLEFTDLVKSVLPEQL